MATSDDLKPGDRRVVSVSHSKDYPFQNVQMVHYLSDGLLLDFLHKSCNRAYFFLTKESIDLTGQIVLIEMLEERYDHDQSYSIWRVVEPEEDDTYE